MSRCSLPLWMVICCLSAANLSSRAQCKGATEFLSHPIGKADWNEVSQKQWIMQTHNGQPSLWGGCVGLRDNDLLISASQTMSLPGCRCNVPIATGRGLMPDITLSA